MRTFCYVLCALALLLSLRCEDSGVAPPEPLSLIPFRGLILFSVYGGGSALPDGVWALDLHEGTYSLRLVAAGGSDGRISTDGKLVVYAKVSPQGSQDIYFVPAAGGPEHDLTNRTGVSEYYPDIFSGIPTVVAFSAFFATTTSATAICRVDTGGSGLRALTDTVRGAPGSWAPRWSPDGLNIACIREVTPIATSKYALVLLAADGSESRDLAESGNLTPPAWSLDGLFVAYETPSRGIGVINLQTGLTKELTSPGKVFIPNGWLWTKTGEFYCFGRTSNDSLNDVFLFPSPFADATHVTIPAGFCYGAVLLSSPEGKTIGILGGKTVAELSFYILNDQGSEFLKIIHLDSGGAQIQPGGFAQWVGK